MNNASTSVISQSRPSRRGRRPAAEVRDDVLRAAGELLHEGGLSSITFESVASRAGASRTTLHKWWPSPAALAAEAYLAGVQKALGFRDTGDVEADVRRQLYRFARLMNDEPAGRVARELIGAAQGDEALREAFAEGYARPRRDEAIAVLRRAQERGQLRSDAPLDVLVDQLWGACYHRLLILNQRLTRTTIDALVANAFYGATAR